MRSLLLFLLGACVLLAAPMAAVAGHGTTLQIVEDATCTTQAVVATPTYEAQRLRIEVGPRYTQSYVQRIETPVVEKVVERVCDQPVESVKVVEKVQAVPVERVQVVERVVLPQKTYVAAVYAAPQKVLQVNSHHRQQVLQLNAHHGRQAIVVEQRRSPVLQLNVDSHHHGGNDALSVRQRNGLLGNRTTIRSRR